MNRFETLCPNIIIYYDKTKSQNTFLRNYLTSSSKYIGMKKAADGNRTRDLRTTNATLYRLSHSSNYTHPHKMD